MLLCTPIDAVETVVMVDVEAVVQVIMVCVVVIPPQLPRQGPSE